MKIDTVIKNAVIYDGLGNNPVEGSVGISDDQLVINPEMEGKNVIDAGGLSVAPGFINLHSHSELPLLIDGRVPSILLQGITTEVVGNCGFSPAPLAGEALEEYKSDVEKDYDIKVDWTDFKGYFDRLESRGAAINVLALAGHGTIRGSVMGLSDRPPSAEEMGLMKLELLKAMNQGAAGISTGLIYPPGVYSRTDELIQLAQVARRMGGFYSSHVRGEGKTLLSAIEEALAIGRFSGAPVEISHIKAAGEENFGKVSEALRLIHKARSEGVSVQHDQYPYEASATGLSMILPDWVHDGGTQAMVRRLKDPDQREKIKEELLRDPYTNGRVILVSHVTGESNRHMEGESITDLAEKAGKSVTDFILDLLAEEEGSVGAIFFSMNESDVIQAMSDPYTSICTDAGASAIEGPLFRGRPHPRTYGAFPRVLGRYVREKKVLTLQEAIRRMTSLPARMLKLCDRGILADGFKADLVIFDPDKIIDTADFKNPHSYPRGISHIFVNGRLQASHNTIHRGFYGRVLGPCQKELIKIV